MVTMETINWSGTAQLLVAVPLIALALAALLRRYFWQRSVSKSLATPKAMKKLLTNFSLIRKVIKTALLALGVIFLALALARPQWQTKDIEVTQRGRDLIFALDISRSMLAEDVSPNRLELAKQKIKQLISRLSSDRVGLIVFSGDASFQCPITTDFDAFHSFLDALDVETISSGTTRIDLAIIKALATLQNEQDQKSNLSNKLLIVITDGEDFSGLLSQAAAQAAEAGLHIFALGIGTEEGAPIPLFDDEGTRIGHQRDADDAIVFTRLNEPLLENLATQSGADYVRVTDDDTDITTLLNKIQEFKAEEFASKTIKQQDEKFYYPAFASLICFLVEWVI